MWPPRNRVSMASVLYFVSRYLGIAGHIIMMYYEFMPPADRQVRAQIYLLEINPSNLAAV